MGVSDHRVLHRTLMAPRLSGVGLWSANLRYGDAAEAADAAAELAALTRA